MDGVIVNNTEYHERSWQIFYDRHDLGSDKDFRTEVLGHTTRDHLQDVFGRELKEKEIRKLSDEKEKIYRDIYSDEIEPVAGLIPFLKDLKNRGIQTALATAATEANVEFVLGRTDTRDFFDELVDATMAEKGKPDPEIFLVAAGRLGKEPLECIVFEDSVNGIKAAKNAGMNVVALTTTLPEKDLPEADLYISKFTEISMDKLVSLMKRKP